MPSRNCVFVTGGAGFIGSHTVVELLNAGYDVIVIDNFVNSVHGEDGQATSIKRVEEITGKQVIFYKCDLLEKPSLSEIFDKHKVDFVIHFAAMKAVGESMQKPLFYYKCNVVSTINLLEVMKEHGVYNMVFSSSCVVYGNPQYLPIDEAHSIGNVTNVYGRTKYAIEQMLEDICRAEKPEEAIKMAKSFAKHIDTACLAAWKWNDAKKRALQPPTAFLVALFHSKLMTMPSGSNWMKAFVRQLMFCTSTMQWNIISLRYFNPVGAHSSGLIGEDPTRAFTNLMPYIGDVAMGKKSEVVIFGGDYNTIDGTGVRDFIHVMDLATGHVAALKKLAENPRYKVYNLGTGTGYTVLQLIHAFERVSGKKVNHRITDRRLGDIPAIWGDCQLAEKELGWRAAFDLDKMCEDFWHWQTLNPNGYRTEMDQDLDRITNGMLNI